MKTICWNQGIIIKAENNQDAQYLTTFIKEIEYKDILSGWVELEVGEFDSNGILEDSETMFLTDIHKDMFWEKDVVEINFRVYFDYSGKQFKKILQKTIDNIK